MRISNLIIFPLAYNFCSQCLIPYSHLIILDIQCRTTHCKRALHIAGSALECRIRYGLFHAIYIQYHGPVSAGPLSPIVNQCDVMPTTLGIRAGRSLSKCSIASIGLHDIYLAILLHLHFDTIRFGRLFLKDDKTVGQIAQCHIYPRLDRILRRIIQFFHISTIEISISIVHIQFESVINRNRLWLLL